MKKQFIALFLCLMWAIASFAQPVEIEVLPTTSANFTKVGNFIFFSTHDSLMKTDGTAAGTVLVKAGLNQPNTFKESNGLLYFINGTKDLWKSDGTNAGTILLKSFTVGEINFIQTVSSFLYFTARETATGRELYRSNGTEAGTIMLRDINPGPGDGAPTSGYLAVGNIIYYQGTDPTHGTELWVTSGTISGTSLLKDVRPGPDNGFIKGPWALAGKVYFAEDDGTHGMELWVTNGSSAGTMLVKDIIPGPESGFSGKTPVGTNSIVYFTSSNEQIWKTNGTEAGTTLVKDFSSITNTEHALDLLYTYNNTLYFFKYQVFDFELWKSDGTDAGTVLYSTFNSISSLDTDIDYTKSVVVLEGKSYVMLSISQGIVVSILVTDGTSQGSFIDQVAIGGDIVTDFITTMNHNIIYAVYTQNAQFAGYYKSNGTIEGSGYFTHGSQSNVFGRDFTTIGNKGFFTLNTGGEEELSDITFNPDDYHQLFITDLTSTNSLRSLYGISLAGSNNLINLNGVLYFTTLNTNTNPDNGIPDASPDQKVMRLWSFNPAITICSSTGTLLREVWDNIAGSTVASIPYNTVTPTATGLVNIFEGPTNVGNLYGARYRGYICVPTTGNYTFWIASDDNSELWLSTDATPENRVKIAYVNGYTNPRQWDKYPSQKSALIPLVAGRRYYIEALHKENYGNDNLAVGWQLPGGTLERPIPGMRLSPFNNLSPYVQISAPENNQHFDAPATIDINAYANDSDGFITKIEFYNGATKIGEDTTNAFSFTWTNVPAGIYILTVKAFDNDGGVTTSQPVTVTVGACTASGTILREYWANVSGSTVSTIPVNTTPTSTSLLNIFEGPTNIADLYGARYRGYICVPATGNYTFWIASDDNSELWLSTDNDPSHKVRIAYVDGWTNPRVYNKYTSQQSSPIYLVAGTSYYIEALHKEAYGNDNLSVGWQLPDGTLERPIPGIRLSPYTGSESLSSSLKNSINNEDEISVTILPNPTGKGRATLIIEGEDDSEKDVTIEITNIQGHSVYKDKKSFEGRSKDLTINIDDQFQPGMYIVHLLINGQVYIERLIVE